MMRFDPFRDLDRLADQLTSGMRTPRTAPMDVYRLGDHYVVHLDLPGVDPGSVDLSVEDNALTVRAHRTTRPQGEGMQVVVAERPSGEFVRQLFLGEGLDTERIEATYDQGVLTLHIPVAERAKPRKIEVAVGGGESSQQVIQGSTEQSAVGAGRQLVRWTAPRPGPGARAGCPSRCSPAEQRRGPTPTPPSSPSGRPATCSASPPRRCAASTRRAP